MNTRLIRKVALAVFKDGKILMTRDDKNPEVFYFVGGSCESGEDDIDCLQREIREELCTEVDLHNLHFLKEFSAPAHGKENTTVIIRLYQGKLVGEPTPSNEVVELQYLDGTTDPRYLSEIALDHIFPWLIQQSLLNG